MDVKLRSAESAIHFLQSEHKSVLSGLHEEIQRLQQKCSGKYQSHYVLKDIYIALHFHITWLMLRYSFI